MAQVEMIMPKMGESVAEATILKWLKNEGDKVDAEESVLEIATDKVDSEVPAPTSGVILKTLFKEGDVVKVGAVIAIIGAEGDAPVVTEPHVTASTPVAVAPPTPTQTPTQTAPTPAMSTPSTGVPQDAPTTGRFYSPLVRSIAQQEGIASAELETIPGTGLEGRVTKKDMLAYVSGKGVRKDAPAPSPAPATGRGVRPDAPAASPAVSMSGNIEIVEMDRMRKLISEHMVMSKHTSPHVTSFVEADVTNMVLWRNKIKSSFEKREGEKITFTPIFIEAIAQVIKEMPMINVSLDGTKIIIKKNINIGMAAALPSGNLIVPVIKNADQMNLLGLTKAVNDLANRARNNKLQPDDIQGGTFTLTNVGTFGNVMGTPIINQPQVAIMATGAIQKKPAVIETPQGDTIGIRHMMFLSMSYDHRIVDGALGGRFIRRVADILEAFDMDRTV